MKLKEIINALVVLSFITGLSFGLYFLIDFFIYIYQNNLDLVEQQRIIKQSQTEIVKDQINNFLVSDISLDSSKKTKKYINVYSLNEQKIKLDLIQDFKDNNIINQLNSESGALLKDVEDTRFKDLIIKIPSIGINIKTLPIPKETLSTEIYEKIDFLLEHGPVRFPGEDITSTGVTTIYSHSSQYKNIRFFSFFRKLPYLTINKSFSLESDLNKYNYTVLESLELSTEEVMLLRQKYERIFPNKKFVFLITCYPINTSKKRWIIVGEQINTEKIVK